MSRTPRACFALVRGSAEAMAKRASDAEEQAVIDDDLIAAALAEEQTSAASKHVGQVALADMVAEAHVLRLSFKNIKRIDNLHGFQALTKLCLDNNVIREISDLDHLVNLEWLDLSFNNIAKIEGLEKLTKLTDLSLFNNLIQDVDGLDTCANLQCLSIGNNNIAALDSIVKLRRFKSLRLLNMEGNPVSKESEYRMYVLAYLNNLTYLDYAMVMKSEIVAAREQYQDELLDVEEKEALEEEKATREAAAARQTAKLQAANLAVVETIFDDMFKEDTEMAKLKYLAGINDIVANFQSEVESASDQFLTVRAALPSAPAAARDPRPCARARRPHRSASRRTSRRAGRRRAFRSRSKSCGNSTRAIPSR